MSRRSYENAIKYLESFIDYEKTTDFSYDRRSFNLGRVRFLLNHLGNPHRDLKVIHIAGTNGKGSTAAMISSILKEANFKVGLYTSPHLVTFRERIWVDGKFISEEEVVDLVKRVKPIIDKFDNSFGPPTFFEVYTTLAMLYFKKEKVDFAVLEVGMGGRLDATNITKTLISAITPIALDHTDKLGNSRVRIAKEKAGIIKRDGLAISSPQATEVMRIIEKVCEERGTRLFKVHPNFESKRRRNGNLFLEKVDSTLEGSSFNVRGIFEDLDGLHLPLLGDHQLINAAISIGAVELLRLRGIEISSGWIREGLRKVRWPGRLELINEKPLIILDGAHNGASAKCLRRTIEDFFPYRRLILILGISANKDIEGIGRELCPLAGEIIITKARCKRAADPFYIRERLKGFCQKMVVIKKVESALKLARSKADTKGLILVAGSLYLVGEALEILRTDEYQKFI